MVKCSLQENISKPKEEALCNSTPSSTNITAESTCTPKKMYVCILDEKGEIREHRNMKTTRKLFSAHCSLPGGYRRRRGMHVHLVLDRGSLAKRSIPFVLGHALYMKAIHGGKAKNDKIDSQKIAALLRGGMIPQSYVYPQRCGRRGIS